MKHFLLYFLAVIGALIGFSFHDVREERPFTSFLKDRLDLEGNNSIWPALERKDFLTDLCYDSVAHRAFLLVYAKRLACIGFFDIANGQLNRTLKIEGLPEDGIEDFCMKNNNLFYFSENELLYECDATHVLKSYTLSRNISDRYYAYASRNEVHLEINSDSTFYQAMLSKGLDEAAPDWMQTRFSMPCVGKFKIMGDSVICVDSVAYFPADFKKTYHYEQFATCIFRGGMIHYLFSDADSIFSYNMQTKTPRTAVSVSALIDKDYKTVPVYQDSTSNMNYIYRHAVSSPAIHLFIYDPYRHVYYLGLKRAQSYFADDGIHLNDAQDYPFSIYVLNENFKKINTVNFPKGHFTAIYKAFAGPKGLYLLLGNRKNISYEIYDFLRPAV